jgi:hypothetical protein
MRVVQRHGRIDRIGSKHPRVYLDCFFPAAHLDRFLELEQKLHRKLAQADAAVGVGDVLPGFTGSEARVFADTHDQIRQLAAEDPTILDGGPGALSGEEYRRRLRKATQPSSLADDVQQLPWGAGSGFVSEQVATSGYTFCARIDGIDKPIFRFVPTDDAWTPRTNDDGSTVRRPPDPHRTLRSRPGEPDTGRHLPPEAYDAAFDAWEIAQTDIHDEWNRLSDPATLQPKLPKAMREAADLVADHGDFLGNEAQQNLYRRLGSVPPPRVERSVRGDRQIRRRSPGPRSKPWQSLPRARASRSPPPRRPSTPSNSTRSTLVAWMAVTRTH